MMRSDQWNQPSLSASGAIDGGAWVRLPAARPREEARALPEVGTITRLVDYLVERFLPSPWSPPVCSYGSPLKIHRDQRRPIYTAEERSRRDSTVWTLVQGVLAPIQFLVFLASLALVVRYINTGVGYEIATASVVLKTLILYAIMVTGSIWEKKVFGKYLFAPAFFWEDAVSMVVIALHTAYLLAVWSGWGSAHDQMNIALAAYGSYAINAAQFILKFRAARLEFEGTRPHALSGAK